MAPSDTSASDPDDRLSFFNSTIQSCPQATFHEMTGEVGDVILLHPLMLHSASKNGLRNIRIITNPPVSLLEPFNFDRGTDDPSAYSLVELKTIRDLGGFEKLRGWRISGERKPVVPERLRVQARMMEEENRRLRESGREYTAGMKTEEQVKEPAAQLQSVAVA